MSNKINSHLGRCLIDGLTLQNASDILCMNSLPDEFDSNLIAIRNQYLPYQEAIEVAIQLTSLAQLVEALLCYDQIVTTSSHKETWLENHELKKCMDIGIINFPDDIAPEVKDQLDVYSSQKMIKFSKSNAFQLFVDNLTKYSIEGTIFNIARHYHGLSTQIISYYRKHDITDHIDEICEQASYMWYEEQRSKVSHVASIFGTGAFYYQALSTLLQVTYSPFCLRTPFCIYNDVLLGSPPMTGVKLAMNIIKNEAANYFIKSTGTESNGFIEFDFPPVFAFILKQAKTRSDILPCALRMRETTEVMNFRNDLNKLNLALNNGDIPNAVQIADMMKKKIKETFQINEENHGVKVNIGFAGFEVELPIKLPNGLSKMLRKHRRTTFYHLLMSKLPTIWQLNRDISRLFGINLDPKIQEFIHTYQ